MLVRVGHPTVSGQAVRPPQRTLIRLVKTRRRSALLPDQRTTGRFGTPGGITALSKSPTDPTPIRYDGTRCDTMRRKRGRAHESHTVKVEKGSTAHAAAAAATAIVRTSADSFRKLNRYSRFDILRRVEMETEKTNQLHGESLETRSRRGHAVFTRPAAANVRKEER